VALGVSLPQACSAKGGPEKTVPAPVKSRSWAGTATKAPEMSTWFLLPPSYLVPKASLPPLLLRPGVSTTDRLLQLTAPPCAPSGPHHRWPEDKCFGSLSLLGLPVSQALASSSAAINGA
jgi:hypothetical protein